MTELLNKYLENKEAAKEEIKGFDNSRLLAELEDTVQFDLMKMSTADFIKLPKSQTYIFYALLREVADRLNNLQGKEN